MAVGESAPSDWHATKSPLATVSARVDHRVLRPGQDLRVTITLTAGRKGAYLPNFFDDFNRNCQSGFAAAIFTLEGEPASSEARGCGGAVSFGNTPARDLLNQYIYLKPGEKRRWTMLLTEISRQPGTYEVLAEFLSGQIRIKEVAALPEVRGLMEIGDMRAKAVRVRIR